jgi:dipeptidyl aminopeptidase/acylaminoacyl peptidase
MHIRAFYFLLIAAFAFLSACAHGYRSEGVTLVSDGLKVNNLVYLPGDMAPGRKYPGLILCHGGNKGIEFTTRGWARELARKGFVVVLPQFRGQDGSEGRFEFAGGEVDDAEAALDYIDGLPYVDKDRTGVVGYSIGGLVALRLAERRSGLRAVVLVSAISDPVGFFDALLAGKPPEAREKAKQYIKDALERSPLANIASINAPVLIVHGESDGTVDPGQSRRLYQLLRSAGKDVSLRMYPGVNHEIMWFWAPREDVTSWLLKRLEH